MTLAEGKQKVYSMTGSDANSYSAASFVINLNIWVDKVLGMIMRKQGTWNQADSNNSGDSLSELDIVANQGYLDIPAGTIGIRRVDLALDGTNFYKAEPINDELINDSLSDTTKINSLYTVSNPRYVLSGNRIKFYPQGAVNVTKGCKLYIDADAYKFTTSDLSTGTKSIGFDREFHDMVFCGVAWEWAKAKQKAVKGDLEKDLANYSVDLGLHYADKNKDEAMAMQSSYVNYN